MRHVSAAIQVELEARDMDLTVTEYLMSAEFRTR